MGKVKRYAFSYGDVIDHQTGDLLRVQDCYGLSGRLVAIRPGFSPYAGHEGRVWRGIALNPAMLGKLIVLLQAANHHHTALMAYETIERFRVSNEGNKRG